MILPRLMGNKKLIGALLLAFMAYCLPAESIAAVEFSALSSAHQPLSPLESLNERIKLNQNQLAFMEQEYNRKEGQLTLKKMPQLLVKVELNITGAELALESAKLDAQRFQNEVEVQQHTIQDLLSLKISQSNVIKNIEVQLSQARESLKNLESMLVLANENLKVTEQILVLHRAFKQKLEVFNHTKKTEEATQKRLESIEQLERERRSWEENLAKLKMASTDFETPNPIEQLQAEENIQVLSQKIRVLRIETRFQELTNHSEASKDDIQLVARLSNNIAPIEAATLKNLELSKKKMVLLEQYLQVTQQSFESHITTKKQRDKEVSVVNGIIKAYQHITEQWMSLHSTIVSFKDQLTNYQQGLTYRQHLPQNLQQWRAIGHSLLNLPTVMEQLLLSQWEQVKMALQNLNLMLWICLILIEVFWGLACVNLWRLLASIRQEVLEEDAIFSVKALHFIADSLARNKASLIILGLVGCLMGFWVILGKSLFVLIALGIVWFVFKFLITISRITLLENTKDLGGKDARLYQVMRLLLVISGVLTSIVVVIHQLILPVNVLGFIDRLYMIILVLISYPLFRNADVLTRLFTETGEERRYLMRAVKLIAYLVPLTIASNAVIGLLGFVNLAWRMALIEAQIILVVCLYLLFRGFLEDLMLSFSEWCIKQLNNGWLWTQAVLRPLHQLMSIALFVSAVLTVFSMLGLNSDSPLMMEVKRLFSQPLFHVGSTEITLVRLSLFLVVLSVVYWASKWSREFAYRWFYNKIKDSGARDSLSILTQYGVVLIGFFLMLNVLGIDLTTITVVAAAFSVGIAFGVRDIVNNVLSGLIMLIERPIKLGDWIKVGDFEGEVTHIGVRAVTVHSPSNIEIIIPNTETMIKPFTNMTRVNSIVRDEFEIRIDFRDNPKTVKKIILDSFKDIEAVVSHPEPEVLIQCVSENALILQIRYFMDMRVTIARARVKSAAISRVWEVLKKEGIRVPLPQQSVSLVPKS